MLQIRKKEIDRKKKETLLYIGSPTLLSKMEMMDVSISC